MTTEDLAQIFSRASQEGLYRHSSVMKPILLIFSGLLGLCGMAWKWAASPMPLICFAVLILVVVVAIVMWAYLAVKNPRVLQSESFQLKAMTLEARARKSGQHLNNKSQQVTLDIAMKEDQ